MRYRVHGVNRQTGTEVSTTIDASSRDMAEAKAQRTMIVGEIEGDVPMETAVASVAPKKTATQRITRHAAIVSTAKELGMLATVFYILSWVSVALGVIFCGAAFSRAEVSGGVMALLAGLLIAVAGRVVAAGMLMLGSIGLAVKDIADCRAGADG
jgi:hypothetical protein